MDPSSVYPSCQSHASNSDDKSHPRPVTLVKDKTGFGFTLRHFIVYPPTSVNSGKIQHEGLGDHVVAAGQWGPEYQNKPMDTIFIREVKDGSPAHNAGLNKGDRIIAINNHPLSGKSYSDIIHLILKSGQTLRLLVVPKEDDILQLYFASSAYQPVHREKKQRKYLVPSYGSGLEPSNQLYRQSTYGTYPGRLHRVKGSTSREPDLKPVLDINSKKSNSPGVLSCVPGDPPYSRSLADDEKYKEHNADQLSKGKDDVEDFYYNACNDDHPVFGFSSEENLNYPIFMSDFDDIVHCDNMVDAGSQPARHSLYVEGTRYPEAEKVNEATYDFVQQPSYRTSGRFDKDPDGGIKPPGVIGNKPGERNSIPGVLSPSFRTTNDDASSDFPFENVKASRSMGKPGDRNSISLDMEVGSINMVAHRKHQIESGDLIAESRERMKLYRSELSRMTKPNHVQIVSSRTAKYEKKVLDADTKDLLMSNSGAAKSHYCNHHQSLDQQNSNQSLVDGCLPANKELLEIDELPDAEAAPVVHRRKTVPGPSDHDDCHLVRRISYLRATASERMNLESDLSEEETSDASSPNKEYRIQKLKTFFGEKTPSVKHALVPAEITDINKEPTQEIKEEPKSMYGWVICKVVSLEGKRSSDRSWRHMWGILRNNLLYLLKERREPTKGTIASDEHVIDVKFSIAKAASDYVKRKNVFRLMLFNGTEYLIQTEGHACMIDWLSALQVFSREIAELPDWLKNTSVLEKASAYEQQIQKGTKKLVFRHRNPSEHSPTVKTRRASQGDELALSKIGVIWKDRMLQGWKKVHGMNTHLPKGASFGVKLENAPPGVTIEHIPLIVELCIQIVEAKGLDVVGIYRVPGNNASVSILTDLVNQGIDDQLLKDPRWNDINIVSSLLKAFFRKLPEPLLTSPLYPKFIQASEIDDPLKRLKAIKHVLFHLPVHYFATLRHLMYHLKNVVDHSSTNKMEARNLAIVFGPTLVRTIDNNMIAMVTDMPQQCYLIETLIVYAEWLFEECGDILPLEISAQDKRKTHPPSNLQSTALLSNINKLDENSMESLPHEMFASFCNAASKHLRHRHKKKDPAEYSKKRSGIIADDCDILAGNHNEENQNLFVNVTEHNFNSKENHAENPCDAKLGISSNINSDAFKSNQRLLVQDQGEAWNGSASGKMENPLMFEKNVRDNPLVEDEGVALRYTQLSALAQEKVRNFEQETRALLRRDVVPRPRGNPGPMSAQVEWEQIEREWQKAKLELEEEDLLDYLADDPSCLLQRGREQDSLGVKSDLPPSTSLCGVQGTLHSQNLHRPPYSMSSSQSQLQLSASRAERAYCSTNRSKSDIPTSLSQPMLSSSVFFERTTESIPEEYSYASHSPKSILKSHCSKSSHEAITDSMENRNDVDALLNSASKPALSSISS